MYIYMYIIYVFIYIYLYLFISYDILCIDGLAQKWQIHEDYGFSQEWKI